MAGAGGKGQGLRAAPNRPRPPARGFRQAVAGGGDQRITEGQVQLDGPGRDVFEDAGGGAEGGLHRAFRVGARGDVGGEPHVLAEEVQLDGGLVGAGAAQLVGPVSGQHHQRHGGVVGLHDGRHEVPDGGPGRGEHGCRRSRGQGKAQGGETGGAFIDPDQGSTRPAASASASA